MGAFALGHLGDTWPLCLAVLLGSYAAGSFPSAYLIVRRVTGDDITARGTGNVGAMNVRRSTGSWGWFVVTMLADLVKGIAPVAVTKTLLAGIPLLTPSAPFAVSSLDAGSGSLLLVQIAVLGVVLGHNYSGWLALLKRRLVRTGKGLATGAGAFFVYNWRYFLAVVVIGFAVIAITRYMLAGQVAAAFALPAAAIALRSPDW
ncbi:MAG TPA: glycerol-3-phosphate acyltransferase, partial [Coriobacteriia bacterium]|nr:glycerol-3-phosphate acyltransferase [Coriobacteriia bacterium]